MCEVKRLNCVKGCYRTDKVKVYILSSCKKEWFLRFLNSFLNEKKKCWWEIAIPSRKANFDFILQLKNIYKFN